MALIGERIRPLGPVPRTLGVNLGGARKNKRRQPHLSESPEGQRKRSSRSGSGCRPVFASEYRQTGNQFRHQGHPSSLSWPQTCFSEPTAIHSETPGPSPSRIAPPAVGKSLFPRLQGGFLPRSDGSYPLLKQKLFGASSQKALEDNGNHACNFEMYFISKP